jgi:hypothetical protein
MPPAQKTEPTVKTPVAEAEPAWAKALVESNRLMAEAITNMGKIISAPQRQQQPTPTPTPSTRNVADPEEAEIDPNVLETLPRAQFMALLEGRMSKKMQKEIMAPLAERMDNLNKGLTSSQIEKMLEAAVAKHPDLMEYQDTMMDLAKVHKTLTPEQLYKMAKDQTPDAKVKEITAKYTKPTEGAKKDTFTFGGMMPTNGGSEERNARMDAPTAAASAWDSVVAEMGGEPAFSE